tara:strand:- start:94 stop:1035 length:942 start_codon:yes stop_codon:yes gene_type:complete
VIKIKKIIFIFLIFILFTEKTISEINDSLFLTVGNRAITKSDIVNEIKIILILNNESYSEDKRDRLHKMAVKQIIKRNIKQIEIEKNEFLEFDKKNLNYEILRLAENLQIDVDTLKNITASNELDFSLIEEQIKVELLWNSLIFQLYKDRLSINVEEIEEQLKNIQNKKELHEYLISEIVLPAVEKNKVKSVVEKLKIKIESEGFEKVAMDLSISDSSTRKGDLGWVSENIISEKLITTIKNTAVGETSDPILLPGKGILIFKVRDKRIVEKKMNLEETKNQLVNSEKMKILSMHSSSHYDKLRRSVSIKYFQ